MAIRLETFFRCKTPLVSKPSLPESTWHGRCLKPFLPVLSLFQLHMRSRPNLVLSPCLTIALSGTHSVYNLTRPGWLVLGTLESFAFSMVNSRVG